MMEEPRDIIEADFDLRVQERRAAAPPVLIPDPAPVSEAKTDEAKTDEQPPTTDAAASEPPGQDLGLDF